ncbi:MAG TPA: Gfo/Idh/MocA family oxidoreductase, partial [Trebonia sp.]|nr:Gfo/Idh/MocA family oxidoreductase [Trebonia sp.]
MSAGDGYGWGIVGCGVIAPTHARAVAGLPNAHLVAVTDRDKGKAAALADSHGAAVAADLGALLARPDVDVVSVCVPSGLHAEVGARAAQAGKHLVIEKPIEVTLAAADRLLGAAAAAGVGLTVISQHRFDPGVRRLRELTQAGRLGRLVLGEAAVKWYRSQGYYDSGDWRGTRALDGGGALMNQGVHYLDLLCWIMGPVAEVTALCATQAHDIEVEDVALALLRFTSGAVGLVQAATAVYPGFPERLEVSGTGGTVVVEGGAIRSSDLVDERGEAGAYGAAAGPAPAVVSGAAPAADTAAADPAAIADEAHRAQLA